MVKLDIHMQQNEARSVLFRLYKNQLKCTKDSNVRVETLKTRRKIRQTLQEISIGNDFLKGTSRAQEIITKNWQI